MRLYPTTKAGLELFLDGAKALSLVEAAGMRIDEDYVRKAIDSTQKRVRDMEEEMKSDTVYKEWQKRYGSAMVLGSHQQLASVVYDTLGYPCEIWTGEGAKRKKSCSEEALKNIDLPFVRKWLERNRLTKKVVGTYLKGLLAESVDGYIHPSFNLNTTWTYRSSCTSPNAQNIPARDGENAKLIRSAFVPRDGHQLIEIDWKASEVAAMACYNGDPVWIDYVYNSPPKDMHRDAAVRCYMIDEYDAKEHKPIRQDTKANFVFAQMYGSYYLQCAQKMWDFVRKTKATVNGLSLIKHLRSKGIKQLGACDPRSPPIKGTFEYHVKEYERWYWEEEFVVYGEWRRRWYADFLKLGYVDILTGFRCAGFLKKNQVLDAPPQATSSHFLQWVTNKMVAWIRRNRMKSRIICIIHDSLIGDVHAAERDDYIYKVKELVTEGLPNHWQWINVPLSVEVEECPVGGNWYEKRQIEF